MADEPLQPDWVGRRDELGREVPSSASKRPGANPDGAAEAGPGTTGATKAVPRDIPVSVGEEAAIDAPVEVRRFAGLANRLLSIAVPLTIIALGALVVLVALAGARGLLGSRGGTTAASAENAVQPVPATGTLLMLGVDGDQDLTGVTLLGLTEHRSDEALASSVLVLSPDLALANGRDTLAALWSSDQAGVVAEITNHFNIAIPNVVVVDPQAQAAIAAAVGPVTVTVTEPLLAGAPDGSAVPVFPSGELTLSGDDVAVFSSPLSPGENRVVHLERQRTLWIALQDAVKARSEITDLDPVLAPFMAGLADPRSQVLVAGVFGRSAIGESPRLELDGEDTSSRLFTVVSNPLAAPGQERPSVRILDASGDDTMLFELRRQIAALGGRTVGYGAVNGREGIAGSRVVVHRAPDGNGTGSQSELTRVLAVALGVESEADFSSEQPALAPAFDITVVIGSERVQDGGE